MRGGLRRTIVLVMTETLHEPPPPPPPPDTRRLVRDPDDRVVAGVCAAFGRYTDTDPVLWRVTIAVLTLFGGAGVVLYVLGWVLVPRRGEPESFVERTLRRSDHGVSVAGVVLLVVAGVLLLAALDDGPGVGALLVVGGIAWLVARERRGGGAPAPTAAAVPYGPVPPPWPESSTAAAPVVTSRRARRYSPLGLLTVSAAALLVGLLLALHAAGVDGVTAPRVVAAALLAVGAGLLVGTWFGRARWLIAVGVVLALLLGATAAARAAGLEDGVGERTWTATGSATYRLGAGEAVLDLRRLDPGEPATLDARVGFGQLTVLVPADVSARVVSDVGLGDISRTSLSGGRTSLTSDGRRGGDDDGDDDVDLHEEFVVGNPADVTVELDLEVGVGEIEVRRVAA